MKDSEAAMRDTRCLVTIMTFEKKTRISAANDQHRRGLARAIFTIMNEHIRSARRNVVIKVAPASLRKRQA